MSVLTCREFVEAVTDFVDGSLDPKAEAAFADHVLSCPGCDRYVKQMAQVMGILRSGVASA